MHDWSFVENNKTLVCEKAAAIHFDDPLSKSDSGLVQSQAHDFHLQTTQKGSVFEQQSQNPVQM